MGDGWSRRGVSLACLIGTLAAVLAPTTPARAEPQVDLALALAVDASGSVDRHRFEL
jgi:hypothetical protein